MQNIEVFVINTQREKCYFFLLNGKIQFFVHITVKPRASNKIWVIHKSRKTHLKNKNKHVLRNINWKIKILDHFIYTTFICYIMQDIKTSWKSGQAFSRNCARKLQNNTTVLSKITLKLRIIYLYTVHINRRNSFFILKYYKLTIF